MSITVDGGKNIVLSFDHFPVHAYQTSPSSLGLADKFAVRADGNSLNVIGAAVTDSGIIKLQLEEEIKLGQIIDVAYKPIISTDTDGIGFPFRRTLLRSLKNIC